MIEIKSVNELKKLPPEEYISALEGTILGLEKECAEVQELETNKLQACDSRIQHISARRRMLADTLKLSVKYVKLSEKLNEYTSALLELTEIKPKFEVNKNYKTGLLILLRPDGLYRRFVDLLNNLDDSPVVQINANSEHFSSEIFKKELKREYSEGEKNIWLATNPSKSLPASVLANYAAKKLAEGCGKFQPAPEPPFRFFGVSP